MKLLLRTVLLAAMFLAPTLTSAQQFILAGTRPTGTATVATVTADFNGDGNPDLVLAGFGTGPELTVQLGNGDSTFTQSQQTGSGSIAEGMVGGDWNNDGIPDLAIAVASGMDIYLGVGDSTFIAARHYAFSAGPEVVTTGDLNGAVLRTW
ncbi:MAG: VCBS repeat-containing protein [Acidobacteriales bacterium]|nr:VCBS repeat-containing protein [Terriglobales bacterium]